MLVVQRIALGVQRFLEPNDVAAQRFAARLNFDGALAGIIVPKTDFIGGARGNAWRCSREHAQAGTKRQR